MTCPEDFYLFPRLKLTLKGRRFYDAPDIIKNAMKELKKLSQNSFQQLYTRWQKKCSCTKGLF
jgi:hypothetical protein